ncbi:MAG: hypothetical protein IPJ50_12395 [Betaproteobacteria bacterium]|nr:hypothetical protein [Betaproteobacteria bacterium]
MRTDLAASRGPPAARTSAEHRAPRRYFNAPLKFNAEHSSLVFPASWLPQPTQLADPSLRQVFLSRIQEMRAYTDQSFREQAHKMLVMLGPGAAHASNWPNSSRCIRAP